MYDRAVQEPKRVLPRKALRNASNEPLQPGPAPQAAPKTPQQIPPPPQGPPAPTKTPSGKQKQAAPQAQPLVIPQDPPAKQAAKQESPKRGSRLARLRSEPAWLQNPQYRASQDSTASSAQPQQANPGQGIPRGSSVQSEAPLPSPGFNFNFRATDDSLASAQPPRKWDRMRWTQGTADSRRTTGESIVAGGAQAQDRGRPRNTTESVSKQACPGFGCCGMCACCHAMGRHGACACAWRGQAACRAHRTLEP